VAATCCLAKKDFGQAVSSLRGKRSGNRNISTVTVAEE